MLGWVLNATNPEESLLLDRAEQQPIYYSDGVPVYEVWIWHSELKLWFVMIADPVRVAERGAVGFHRLCNRGRLCRLYGTGRVSLSRYIY